MNEVNLKQRLVSEGLGTAFLLAAVVGSGMMGASLSQGNAAIALLANTLATAAALVALILTFGPISGAHLNPAVTLVALMRRELSGREAAGYMAAQSLGALVGVGVAHVMFAAPLYSLSQHERSGAAQGFSEFIATFGLIAVISSVSRRRASSVALAVAAYIAAAYWFTASTSFANPAVTFARAFSDTFAGIALADVPLFALAQLAGAVSASALFSWLVPALTKPLVLTPKASLSLPKNSQPILLDCSDCDCDVVVH